MLAIDNLCTYVHLKASKLFKSQELFPCSIIP